MTTTVEKPPPESAVAPGVVDVWTASLDPPRHELLQIATSLSRDERDRATRFSRARDARRFVAGRALVRQILALYADRCAWDLRFGYGDDGKPRLAGDDSGLEFSVSHSGAVLVCAVTHDAAVGADVELVRDEVWSPSLARAVFTDDELDELGSLWDEDSVERMFRAWTRKEAYLKGTGRGLRTPVKDVSITRGAERGRFVARAPGADPRPWTVEDFHPAPGYVGSVAAAAADWTLRRCLWLDGPWIPALLSDGMSSIESGGYA